MKYEYRTAKSSERAKYIDMANMVFSMAHRPHDFSKLLPKVYGPGRGYSEIHKVAVDESGEIRALVGALRGELAVGSSILKTGYVGTVSVHPFFRGEGHMIRLMQETEKALREEGCDIAMLGGQRQRYEYYGFTGGGMALEHSVGRTNVRHALKDVDVSGVEITDVAEGDVDAIRAAHELFNTKAIHAFRSLEDFHIITRTWFSVLKKIVINGAFAGYAVVSQGESRLNVTELMLRDWEHTDLFVKKIITDAGKAIGIITSPLETELNIRLARYEEDLSITAAEQFKIFSFAKVIHALLTLKAEYMPLADGRVSFIIGGKPLTAEVKAGKVSVTETADAGARELTEMQAQHLFFDLVDYRHELPLGWAPLPLYMDKVDEF